MIQLLARPVVWVGGVAVALGIAAGVQTVRLSVEQVKTAEVRSDWDKDIAKRAIAAREALEAQKLEAEDIADKQAEVLNEGIEQYKAMAENERAARLAADRLRDAAKRACGGAAQQGASAVAPGPAASSPADLYADVSRRLDEAADGIALHADDAFIRSSVCAGSYEALRAKK